MSYSYMYFYKYLKMFNFHVTQKTRDIEIGRIAKLEESRELLDCSARKRERDNHLLIYIISQTGLFQANTSDIAQCEVKAFCRRS